VDMISGMKANANKSQAARLQRKEEAKQRELRVKERAKKIASGEHQAQGYFDRQGIFRKTARVAEHHPHIELEEVVQRDSNEIQKGDICFIIEITWLNQWLAFTHKHTAPPPLEISNGLLLTDGKNGREMIEGKRAVVDFRVVNEKVWNYFHERYNGGPIITFNVPDELAQAVPDWIKELDLSTIQYFVDGKAQGAPPAEPVENALKVSLDDKDGNQDIQENKDYHM